MSNVVGESISSITMWIIVNQTGKYDGVQRTSSRKILPLSNSPVEYSLEENSHEENSPVSFSQIIFDEKMFLLFKI